MNEGICINFEAVEEEALQIERAADVFQAGTLNPEDNVTSLEEDENLHLAFNMSQELLVALGVTMDREAVNIRSIGTAFEEYDHMMADWAEQLLER